MARLWSVLVLLAILAVAACTTGVRPKPLRIPAADVPKVLRVRLTDGRITRVPVEDYVRAAIISEFAPPAGDPDIVGRMLDVQAVIARTYALAHLWRHEREGFDLCSTTHCQLYQPSRLKTSMWARAAADATERTSGMVLWFGSSPARTLFHADCGGHTSAAADVWGGAAPPYLKASRDDGAAASAHTAWQFEVERTSLLAALNGDARTRVGRQLREITVLHRDRGGRAITLALRGTRDTTVRAEDLRAVLARVFGAKSVRSTSFDVARRGSRFTFTGRGYGHGVGLCQAGALARLKAGARPEQVLTRYYPGTRLVVLR